ncbi:SRPBCC family protein [Nocardioides solisilvae]|uniref:SRPBCC family protein n=1 Tax=Nocardioides solisilvae TaxID=1542435 RepID=UPI000D740172|nr:SRPBCC family protein [Nocardioides solisilvae]
MPQVTAEVWVPVPPETAFAVSQTTGELRLRWDPFIREQHLIEATEPAKGVRTHTRARVGPRMVSEYVSYRPPTSVGMTMVSGPWFFAAFGGGWRFVWEAGEGPDGKTVEGTKAVWKYTYSVKPAWLRRVAEPIGQWLLGREIRARIDAWARACEDPVVLAAVQDGPG